jgi:hypothetical protein
MEIKMNGEKLNGEISLIKCFAFTDWVLKKYRSVPGGFLKIGERYSENSNILSWIDLMDEFNQEYEAL